MAKTRGITKESTQGSAAENFFVFAVIALLVYLYHAFFWNKYFGIQDGWGNVYAAYIEQGKIPYRDFYLFAQPYSVLLTALITQVFGNTVVALRAWGIGERILIAFLLYLIFRRFVSRSVALLIGVTALIFSTGTYIDLIYEYGQTCFLLILMSIYLILNYMTDYLQANHRRASKYLVVAGACGGLAFITKQSIGLIVPAILMIFLVIFESGNQRAFRCRAAMIYGGMFLIPSLITLLVLGYLGAVQAYLQQVFLLAAQTKGGLVSMLFGAVTRYYGLLLDSFGFASIFVLLFWLNKIGFLKNATADAPEKNKYLLSVLLILFAILAGFLSVYTFTPSQISNYFLFKKHYVLMTIYSTSILLALFLYFKLLLKPLPADEWQWFFLAMLAASVIYSQGLSSDYDVRSGALALGVLLALLYSLKTPWYQAKNMLLNFFCVFLIGGTLMQHYMFPYNWWGWLSPPVFLSSAETNLKPLKGLKMSPYTAQVFSDITRIIRQNTGLGDAIYEFPHMPIFYLLSGHYPSTWAVTDYMDVCSDACAEEDAARIQKTPPKVLVLESFPDEIWKYHEYVFRNGKRSGQRDIQNVLDNLIRRFSYNKVASYPTGINGYTISVWVLPVPHVDKPDIYKQGIVQ